MTVPNPQIPQETILDRMRRMSAGKRETMPIIDRMRQKAEAQKNEQKSPVDDILIRLKSNESSEGLAARGIKFAIKAANPMIQLEDQKEISRKEAVNEDLLIFNNAVASIPKKDRENLHKKIESLGFQDESIKNQLVGIIENVPYVSRETFQEGRKLAESGERLETNPIGRFTDKMLQAFSHGAFGVAQYSGAMMPYTVPGVDFDRAAREFYNSFVSSYETPSEDAVDIIKSTYGLEENFGSNVAGMAGQMIPSMITTAVITYLTGGAGSGASLSNIGRLAGLSRIAKGSQAATRVLRGVEAVAGGAFEGSVVYGLGDYIATGSKDEGFLTGGIEGGLGAGIGKVAGGMLFKKWFTNNLSKRGLAASTARKTVDYMAITAGETATEFGSDWIKGDVSIDDLFDETGLEYLALSAFMALPFAAARSRKGFVRDTFTRMADDNIINEESVDEYTDHFLSTVGGTSIQDFVEYVKTEAAAIGEASTMARESGNVDLAKEFEDFKQRPTPAKLDRLQALAQQTKGEPYAQGEQARQGTAILKQDAREKLNEISRQVEQENIQPHKRGLEILTRLVRETGQSPTGNIQQDLISGVQQFIDEFQRGGNITEFFYETGRAIAETSNFRNVAVLIDLADAVAQYERFGGTKLSGFSQLPNEAATAAIGYDRFKGNPQTDIEKQVDRIMGDDSMTVREKFGEAIKLLHGEEAFNQFNQYFEETHDTETQGQQVPGRVEVRPQPGNVQLEESVREAAETSRILQEEKGQEVEPAEPSIPSEPSEQTEEERREHETSIRLRQSEKPDKRVVAQFVKSDQRFYTPIKINDQQSVAKAIIKRYGQSEIEKIIYNPPKEVNPAVSIALGIELYKQYQSDGRFDKAADIAVNLMLESSDYGRALGMMRTLLMDSTPETFGAIYERSLAEVEKNINSKIEKTRQEVEKLKAKIVEDVLADSRFTQKVDKLTGVKKSTRIDQIKSERQKILSEMTESFGRLNVSFIPSGEQLILAVRLAKTYIEEGVVRVTDFVNRFIADMQNAGMDVTTEAAEAVWNNRDVQNYLGIRHSTDQNKLKDRAIRFLKAQAEHKLLDRWVDQHDAVKKMFKAIQSALSAEISSAAKELGLIKKRTRSYEDVVDRLSLIANNKETLNEIWSKTKSKLEEGGLEEDERAVIDEVFGPIFTQTLRTQSKKAVQFDIRQRGLKIRDIVTASIESQGDIALTIADRLAFDAGLSTADSAQVALAVAEIFDEKKERLRSQFVKQLKKIAPRKKTTIIDRIFQGYNIGIFDNEELSEMYREKYGLPKFDQKVFDRIIKDATDLQTIQSQHFRQAKAVELMSFIQRQSGIAFLDVLKGIWYNGILMHPVTFSRNLIWILSNLAIEVSIIQNASVAFNNKERFHTILYMNRALLRGIKKGKSRAGEIFRRGGHVSTHKLETEVDALDELKSKIDESDFPAMVKLLLNAYPSLLKFGGSRALVATDAMFYAGFKEFRYLQLGSAKLASQGLRGKELRQAISELYAGTLSLESALLQAHNEGYSGQDQKIRAYELIDTSRDQTLTQAAHEYSLDQTLNSKPRGWSGIIADALNGGLARLRQKGKAGRAAEFLIRTLLVPFVNIPANLAYRSWLYTPRVPIFEKKFAHDLDLSRGNWSNEESEMYIRLITGITITSSLIISIFADDDDPYIKITGTGQLDPSAFRVREAAGEWSPKQLKIGDVKISYSEIPGAHLFSLLGNLSDAHKYEYLKFESVGRILTFIMKGFFVSYFDEAMLRDMNILMEKMGRLEDVDPEVDFIKYGSRYVTSYIPRFAQFIDRVIDAEKKDPSLLDAAFLSEIPFARHGEKPALNIFGDPVFYRSEEMWQRIKSGNVSDVMIDQFIKGSMDKYDPAMLELVHADYYPIILPEQMEIEYDSEDAHGNVSKQTYRPSPDERYAINRNAGSLFKTKILELQNDPDYTELTPKEKKSILESVLSGLRFNEKQRILEKNNLIDEAKTIDVDKF